MLSHALPLVLLLSLTTALPIAKPSLEQRAPQDYYSSPFPDTPLTPKYDTSKYGGGDQRSDTDSTEDEGSTNVASSFSPAIQESPFANGNSLHLGRLIHIRERDDDTNVASSFSPAIQQSDFLNGNDISIRDSESGPKKRQDGNNIASSFSPSIQDSPFLNNNNVNVASEDGSDTSNCQSGSGDDGDGNNVASSFSPSIQDSPFLNCNSVNVLSGKK